MDVHLLNLLTKKTSPTLPRDDPESEHYKWGADANVKREHVLQYSPDTIQQLRGCLIGKKEVGRK